MAEINTDKVDKTKVWTEDTRNEAERNLLEYFSGDRILSDEAVQYMQETIAKCDTVQNNGGNGRIVLPATKKDQKKVSRIKVWPAVCRTDEEVRRLIEEDKAATEKDAVDAGNFPGEIHGKNKQPHKHRYLQDTLRRIEDKIEALENSPEQSGRLQSKLATLRLQRASLRRKLPNSAKKPPVNLNHIGYIPNIVEMQAKRNQIESEMMKLSDKLFFVKTKEQYDAIRSRLFELGRELNKCYDVLFTVEVPQKKREKLEIRTNAYFGETLDSKTGPTVKPSGTPFYGLNIRKDESHLEARPTNEELELESKETETAIQEAKWGKLHSDSIDAGIVAAELGTNILEDFGDIETLSK